MQDYAKLYKARYRTAENQAAKHMVRMIRQIIKLNINPYLMLVAIMCVVEFDKLRK
jgi:hypothetical protein